MKFPAVTALAGPCLRLGPSQGRATRATERLDELEALAKFLHLEF
jgi:hypothetical protein